MSTRFGQVMVPASGSTDTHAKYAGSRRGSNTPAPLALGEIDVADGSVLEGQAQPMVADDLDACDVHERLHGHDVTAGARSARAAPRAEPAPNSPATRLGEAPSTPRRVSAHAVAVSPRSPRQRGQSTLHDKTEVFGGSYDVQWHSKPNTEFPAKIYRGQGVYGPITGKKARWNQPIGATVCKRGITTDRTCGTIVSKDHQPSSIPNSTATYITATFGAAPGDSGGPVFVGTEAWGHLEGAAGSNVFYMAANYIESSQNLYIRGTWTARFSDARSRRPRRERASGVTCPRCVDV